MTKRANGEGSNPTWQASTRRWRAMFTDGAGKQRGVYSSIPGPAGAKDCRAKRDKAIAAVKAGLAPAPANLTLAAYLDGWLTTWVVEDPAHTDGTARTYRTNITRHIVPAIGNVPVGKVTKTHVKAMLNAAAARGLSGTSQQLVFDTLNNAMKRGIPDVIQANPCDGVDRPRRDTPKVRPWTTAQAAAFLTFVQGDRMEALWTACLMLGLRRGEALGLTWGAINWDAGTVEIGQQLDKRTRTPRDRKGHGAAVVHVMPARVRDLLRARKAAQLREQFRAGAKWTGNDLDLVFTARYGTPVSANWTTERWATLVTRAGLPATKLHGARHYAASAQYAAGARDREVQAFLGHAEGSSVTRLYVHLRDDANAQAAARMDALHPVLVVQADDAAAAE